MNTKRLLAASFAILAGTTISASAAVIGFDFEDANNGWPAYEKDGYIFEPINLNSSTRCADDGPNPKHCFLEVTQGDPTELTADSDEEEGQRWADGETLDEGSEFDLIAFYINFQGTGAAEDNFMRVYTDAGEFDEDDESWTSGEMYQFIELQIGVAFDNDGSLGYTVYAAGDIAGGPISGALEDQVGYIVYLEDEYLNGATSVFWNASDGANNRVDCVFIGTGSGKEDFSLAEYYGGNCGPSPEVVPVPAAGWLLLGGLASLVAIRKRYTV